MHPPNPCEPHSPPNPADPAISYISATRTCFFRISPDAASAIHTKKVQCSRTAWNSVERHPTNTPTNLLAGPAAECTWHWAMEATETTAQIRPTHRSVDLAKRDGRTRSLSGHVFLPCAHALLLDISIIHQCGNGRGHEGVGFCLGDLFLASAITFVKSAMVAAFLRLGRKGLSRPCRRARAILRGPAAFARRSVLQIMRRDAIACLGQPGGIVGLAVS